jgi:hypothetical protein
MKTDSMIRSEGFEILFEKLGDVDAERFLVMLSKERFDYTRWQRNLWKDKTINEVINIANELEKKSP